METRARYVLIGAFTVFGFLAMLGFLLWFGQSQTDGQFAYYDVLFDNVSGISRGSDVQFAGLSVGQVTALNLDREDPAKVRVRMEVDARAPVKTDSLAILETQGVTGLAAVSIAAGSPDAPLAQEGATDIPTLPAGRSTLQSLTEDTPALIAQARDAANKVNILLSEDNLQKLQSILDNVDAASNQLNGATSGLNQAMADISGAIGSLAEIKDQVDPLAGRATALLDNVDTTVTAFRGLKDQAQTLLDSSTATINGVGRAVDESLRPALTDLEKSSASLRGLVDRIGPQADDLMTTWTDTGAQLTARLDQTEGLISSIKATADAFDADTMARVNAALTQLAADLPQITGDLRGAAQSASSAFASLGQLVDGGKKPVGDFLRAGLPQFTRLADEARSLIRSLESTVARLNRNPTGTFLNTDIPEFRR